VGKTTLLRQEFPDWTYVVFDPVQDIAGARSDPDLFLQTHSAPMILDEMQYAPELAAALKRRVDEAPDRMGQYILTGSQQWQVLRQLSESLAGRVGFLDLEGFTLAEQGDAPHAAGWLGDWLRSPETDTLIGRTRIMLPRTLFSLVWRGSLPRACLADESIVTDLQRGYLRTYIERDARMLANLSDWQQFGMFVRLMASLTAREINYSQLGRDIGITPLTAKRWLRILEGTFQWYEIPAFAGNMVKRVSSKPKGYLADTGLACHVLQITSPGGLAGHVLYGPLFETFVVAEIRKLIGQDGMGVGLYHWRSAGGAEVDIILERDGVLYPIEIKGSTRVGRGDLSGVHAFRKSYPDRRIAPGLVIAPVDAARPLTANDAVVPWDSL
jgi:predicted AAA+ superfamily ATPase